MTLNRTLTASMLAAAFVLACPSAEAQQNNIGSCGWGTKLFDGQSGIAPQVLAVTTNGTSGNQTFAITSGTSGCTQNGTVKSSWKTAMFIDNNMNRLALDISAGRGETLDSLASLVGVDEANKSRFNTVLKENFGSIFPTDTVSSGEVYASLKTVLASDSELAVYSASL